MAEHIGDGLGIRAVILSQGQDPIGDGGSYANAVGLPSLGNLRKRLLKFGIERCLEVRIQFYEDFCAAAAAAASWEAK